MYKKIRGAGRAKPVGITWAGWGHAVQSSIWAILVEPVGLFQCCKPARWWTAATFVVLY
jgi:hypothetical protein